ARRARGSRVACDRATRRPDRRRAQWRGLMQTKSSGLAGIALVLVGVVALSGLMLAVAMLGQHGCGDDVAPQAGPANATARKEIPPKLLPLFQQVGAQERVY